MSTKQTSKQPSSSFVADYFCLLLILSNALALSSPACFSWMTPWAIKMLTRWLVFMMGTTASPSDFQACLNRPRPILVNFVTCFLTLPAVALGIARVLKLPEGLLVGLVLVGGVNGGSASNLFTLLVNGDVALSVLMTISTTLGAVACTPLVAKVYLGAFVPVDSMGILLSAIQLVLLPISLGVCAAMYLPRTTRKLQPAIPAVGLSTCLPLIGGVVAGNAEPILIAGPRLHLAIISLHFIAAAIGYLLAAMTGSDERERRTVTIEVTMKNQIFACMLAAAHFEDPAVQVPPAVGCIWCPMVVGVLAALWKAQPIAEKSIQSPSGSVLVPQTPI